LSLKQKTRSIHPEALILFGGMNKNYIK